MTDAAKRLGVTVSQGVTAQTIEDGEDAIGVTFTDGETRRYDLLVGADGIASRTRTTLFPNAPNPAYSGQLSIRWMAPGPAIEGEGWYLGPIGRLGFYYLPQGLVYVPAVINMPEWKRMSHDEVFSLFTRLIESYTAPAIVELRSRLMRDAHLLGTSFQWILLPTPWYRGRSYSSATRRTRLPPTWGWAAAWRSRTRRCWANAWRERRRCPSHWTPS